MRNIFFPPEREHSFESLCQAQCWPAENLDGGHSTKQWQGFSHAPASLRSIPGYLAI
jgi:hypothetical protein